MFKWNPETTASSLLLSAAMLLATGLTGCAPGGEVAPTATKQGTVNVDALKVGMPETTIKEAILTFVPDQKGSIAGKTQYLSRTQNANGGQVIAQCRGDQVFGLQVYHLDKPVSKEVAIESMKSLFPAETPPQSKVDDKSLKEGKDVNPVEVYWFGDDYRGELIYTDKTGSQVKIISAWYEPASSGDASKAAAPSAAETAKSETEAAGGSQ